jgi:ssDNA-binding Zn-finger/Zn-ribbon topoisomerase 1
MKEKIECPNCGKAYLVKKKLHLGKPKENIGTEIVCECPKCKVLLHEEQLGIKLN